MPAYCTGVGKALLAFGPPERLAAVLAAGLARRTPRTVIAPGLLRRELAPSATSAWPRSTRSPRSASPAWPPRCWTRGQAVAAISITGWANRLDTARLAPAVRTAALGLSRALRTGGGAPPR